jgi:hypothetical protein
VRTPRVLGVKLLADDVVDEFVSPRSSSSAAREDGLQAQRLRLAPVSRCALANSVWAGTGREIRATEKNTSGVRRGKI